MNDPIIIDADEIPSSNGNTPRPKAPSRTAILEQRVATLETSVATLIWLHAELIFKAKMAAAEKLLANPQIRERLKAVLAAQIQNPT